MADGRRRRFRKEKVDERRPTILERPTGNVNKVASGQVQPKILLKTKGDKDLRDEKVLNSTRSAGSIAAHVPQRTIIVTRSDAMPSPGLLDVSPNITQEGSAAPQLFEPVPLMTRTATVISSTGLINTNSKKLLNKTNSGFLVVGIIGAQGVGKSTVLNILANDQHDFDYFEKLFVEEDGVFPTKIKQTKYSSRARTESTHMFITADRLILLDSPPVLSNSYKKDMTTNELDDLRTVVSFLSVCHLLIVVQDDFFNMALMRLLQLAELMKPTIEKKPFAGNYFPNVLFIKNRAKRQDYTPGQKQRMDSMLRKFFKDSQLRIYVGQTTERQKKGRVPVSERVVNSFLLPVIEGPDSTPYHDTLHAVVEQLRALVFMTPRNEVYMGSSEFNELVWFELFAEVSQNTQNFFFNTYEEVHCKHLEINSGGAAVNAKDLHENWRE